MAQVRQAELGNKCFLYLSIHADFYILFPRKIYVLGLMANMFPEHYATYAEYTHLISMTVLPLAINVSTSKAKIRK